ncbi:MAG: polysaccharide biosynthesis protein [Lachnospiraceae bacterium]|nr:polysaccharide biosynthesis protein [Lachnospiraceae bacterium]
MNQKKSIKNLILNGGILAVAGILVRVIGLLYRIPMVNIIGAEANGIYSASYNVYNIMLVLSSYGLPMAVSKLVSNKLAKRQYRDAKKIFRISLTVASVTGGLAACVTFFGAHFIEKHFYEDYVGIALPLKVLAPTILIVSVLGVFRGFYQGQGTTIPTALSQLMEQIVNAIVSIVAGYLLIHSYKDSVNAAGYGAAGGTMGTLFGALTALVIVVAIYMMYRPVFCTKVRKDHRSIDEETSEILRVIIVTMIPIIIGQTFYQISAVFDDIMFGKMMSQAGFNSKEIAIMLGNYSSSYTMLTGVVMGIASAMSASMLPSIVASKARGEYKEINEKISATVKTNMLVAIPAFMGLVVLGEPVVELLFRKYDSSQGGMMLTIGGIAVVFYTMSTVTSSALQGIDKMNEPVWHSCISLVIHIVLLFILLRFTNLGIFAVVIGTTTFPVVIMILNLLSLNKYLGYTQEVVKTFLIPSICGIIMSVCVVLIYNLFIFLTNRNIIAIFFALIAAVVSYFGLLLVLKKKRIY